MNLAPIVIDDDEARAKLAEYERVLADERSAEDAAIVQAYRAVRRGLPVIRLSEVVHAGGYFDDGRPRIAIVRADATECFLTINRWDRRPDWSFVFSAERFASNRGAAVGRSTVRVATPGPETCERPAGTGRTIVPLIPPKVRPRRPRLTSCHVLWEVERWDPTPPVDPALVRHLRGDLWSVLATWNLTDLERAVLGARRS